jgi:retron-type reverse transcriptase
LHVRVPVSQLRSLLQKQQKKKSFNCRSVTWLAGKRTSSFSAHNRRNCCRSCNSEVMTNEWPSHGICKDITWRCATRFCCKFFSNSAAVREVVP